MIYFEPETESFSCIILRVSNHNYSFPNILFLASQLYKEGKPRIIPKLSPAPPVKRLVSEDDGDGVFLHTISLCSRGKGVQIPRPLSLVFLPSSHLDDI